MPYFYELSYKLTNEDQDRSLLDYAAVFSDQFYLIPYRGGWDGNQLLRIEHESQLPWLTALRDRIPLKINKFVLVQHPPDCSVIPHKDRNPLRRTVLATALTPLQDYADTVFWHQDREVARCQWRGRSVILDTQETHSVTNGSVTRISFQLCFSESFDEVVRALGDQCAGSVSLDR